MGIRKNDYPPYMHDDGDRGGFVVRNPLTGKKRRFGPDQEQHARDTAKALAEYVERERQLTALDHGRPRIAGLVDAWERDKLQFMPWDEGTRGNMLAKLRRIRRELGDRIVERTDCMFIEDWIASFARTGDTFNKWRYAFILLWRYAVSRKLAKENEPEKIEQRSTSKKLEMNQKQRQPLDLAGFKEVYKHGEPWLQLAMDISLVTLLARFEVCEMQHSHFRNGHLFVIRDKVSGDSEMAFIKIKLTPQLEEFRSRSRELDNTVSPFIVHRKLERRRRQWLKGKPHWTYVMPDYLTRAFAEARDLVPRYATMPPEERPSYHEIRGLGSRIYRDHGMSDAAIQALMTHSNPKTTQIYLDGGAEALSDDDYQTVSAPLRLRDLG